MTNKEKYDVVIWAKGYVAQMIYRMTDVYPENVADVCRETLKDWQMPFLRKVAILTVIMSGTIFKSGGFNMPTTACCIEGFDTVYRELLEGDELCLPFVWDDEEYADYPIGDYFIVPCKGEEEVLAY